MSRIIGKTFEGDNIVSINLRNFALVERTGEVLTYDGVSFGESSFHKMEITPTHHHYTVDAIINFEKLSHRGNILTKDDDLIEYANGTPYEFYEYEDEPSKEEHEIFDFMKNLFEDEDFEYDDISESYGQEWGIVKINEQIAFLHEDEDEEIRIYSSDASINEIAYSIYMAKAFIELDTSCFVDLKAIDSKITLEKIETEKQSKIRAVEIERVTGVPANTISKLRTKIKKEKLEKDIRNMESYINDYLFVKYLN